MYEVISTNIFTLSSIIHSTRHIHLIHTLWNMNYKNMAIKKLFIWVNIHHLPILKVASHYVYIEALKYIGIVYSTEAVLQIFSCVGYEHIIYL